MANMCENKVIVVGENKADMRVLKKLICGEGGVLDFHKIIPLDGVDGLDGIELYRYVVGAWGTKGSVGDVSQYRELYHTDKRMELEFDTAWSPPTPVVARIRELIEENDLDIDMCWNYEYFGEDICGEL